jgi:hypothetical protein
MGAWGTAISSNDTYNDTYQDFFELYDKGEEVGEISKKLIAKNQETINDPDDCHNFWFALAKAQWESKQLDKELYKRVKDIIDTGADIEVWRQLDADPKDLKKRKLALDKFLFNISVEKTKARPRKRKIIRQPIFGKGDCVTFKFENGNYGGAVILEAVNDSQTGLNLVAMTRINQKQKPSIKDFENTNVLIRSFASWKDDPAIGWFYASSFKRDSIKLEVIGNIKVEILYDPNDYSKGFYYGGSDGSLVQIPTLQFEFEQTNSKPSKSLTIKKLIKKNKWKIW